MAAALVQSQPRLSPPETQREIVPHLDAWERGQEVPRDLHRRAAQAGLLGVGFDEAVARADRVTVAVTLFALLELYKQGEATWIQGEPFGEITIEATPSAPAAKLRATG